MSSRHYNGQCDAAGPEMTKGCLFSWLVDAAKSLCLRDLMVKNEPAFEDSIDFLKDLLGQPLSEETKDGLIRSIESLTLSFRQLEQENQRLKNVLQNKKHVSFSPSTSDFHIPSPQRSVSGSSRMVDLLRLPMRKPELVAPRTPAPRKPEPLRTRNSREVPRDIKFSKFAPLPAIKGKPKLIRERTYDVIEPIFVKGPLQAEEERHKLPEIKKFSGMKEVGKPSGKGSRTTSSPMYQQSAQRKNKPQLQKSENKRTNETFDPSVLAPPSDIPTNVFWFPM